MKNEKVAILITITVIIACILGIIAICYNYFKDDVLENDEISNLTSGETLSNENFIFGDEESENIKEEDNQFENVEKIVNKIDEYKPIVYDAINKEILGVDIKLPYINIDSEDVRNINDDIDELIQKYEKENVKDFIEFGGIEYFYVETENILSIITKHPNEAIFYDVININKYTGKKLNNLEILTLYNIPYDKINLKEIYENAFIDEYISEDLVDEFLATGKLDGNEFAEEIVLNLWKNREYWLPENNLKNIPIYIDEEKYIHIIVNLPVLAGATDGINQVDYKFKIENLDSVYIIRDSNTKVIDKNDLVNLTDEQLNIAYNEIFARHSHDFKTQSLKEYFNSLSWYEPIEGKTVTLEELNNTEKNNVKTIKEEIDSRKNNSYLNLNKTSIDDLIAQNNINLLELNEGNHEISLGKIKLGNIECDLIIAFNIFKDYIDYNKLWYKDLKVIIKNDSYHQVFNMEAGSTLDDNSFKEFIQISTVDNKFFIINGSIYGTDWDTLRIFDETGLIFNEGGFNLEYNIEREKVIYSAHNKEAVPDIEGLTKYYKTYYEIVEVDGNLKANELRVDYEDVYRSAQI